MIKYTENVGKTKILLKEKKFLSFSKISVFPIGLFSAFYRDFCFPTFYPLLARFSSFSKISVFPTFSVF